MCIFMQYKKISIVAQTFNPIYWHYALIFILFYFILFYFILFYFILFYYFMAL